MSNLTNRILVLVDEMIKNSYNQAIKDIEDLNSRYYYRDNTKNKCYVSIDKIRKLKK